MDMLQVFHMNKGEGDASYAKNSAVQNNIISLAKPYVEEAIQKYLDNNGFPETIAIADLGCSSGPTALKVVSEIMEVVKGRWRKTGRAGPGSGSTPKVMVFLNDLPGNDFNGIFASLTNFHKKWKGEKVDDFGECFIAGLPGTFYGRLLPNNNLHFVHSSSSLHWLSQVPPGLDGKENPKMVNKGKICVSVTSPSEVKLAYKQQFENDFLSFLKFRSYEVISGGRMVLTFMGRRFSEFTSADDCYPWDFIAQSLMSMVYEGLIEEKMVDNFNAPYYAPCLEEVKQLIEKDSSFYRDRLVALEVDWDGGNDKNSDDCNPLITRGEKIAKMHRAVTESMFGHYFGEDIIDQLFIRYAKVLDQQFISNPNPKIINLVISLIKK